MSFLRKALGFFAEGMLVFCLFILVLMVVLGLYVVPAQFKPAITMMAMFFLLSTLFWIGILALLHRLELMMGVRNLIKHRSDSVIAIFGFMVGTSIICSSMAIGDTMSSLVEELAYESFHLIDEYMVIQDGNGEPIDVNGTLATRISDVVWELEDEGLVDGVSWEYTLRCSVIDNSTRLFEPVIECRALDPVTYGGFGPLRSGGSDLDYSLGPDEVYIGEDLSEKLESTVGNVITVAYGTSVKEFKVKAIVDEEGRGASMGSADVYLAFPSIWALSGAVPEDEGARGDDRDWSGGVYNVLYISNEGGRTEGADLCSEVIEKIESGLNGLEHPLGPESTFKISGDKESTVKMNIDSMDMFTKMFLVLGTFTIIAGITLIINIFVMLSEERKEEMGISRAVGMKRKDLRLTYLFEGALYSIISSFVGVLLGIVSGLGMIWGLQTIFDSLGAEGLDLLSNYTVTPLSIILSFVSGFTITIATTLFITRRVARLNIVSAIRNTPVPKKRPFLVTLTQRICGVYDVKTCSGDGTSLARVLQYMFDRMTILGMVSITVGLLLTVIGVLIRHFAPTSLGISLVLIGLTLVIKYFTNERITYTIAGILVLLFWIVPIPFFEDYAGGLEMFILSGIFMVSSGVMLLVWNTDVVLWLAEKVMFVLGLAPATIKMAISYPVKKRFRTGVTVFMFALIIFTITGMSMIVHILNVNIAGFERTLGGGYSIIGVSNVGIEDLEGTLMMEESLMPDIDVHDKVDWDRSVSLSSGLLTINMTMVFQGMVFENEVPYQCAGVNDRFIERNSFGFSDVDWDLVHPEGVGDRSDREVWRALSRNRDLIVLDGAMGGDSPFGPAGQAGTMAVGDVIELVTVDGRHMNRTIVGFTEQMGINAVFMHNTTAEDHFGVTEKRIHLFSLGSEGDEQGIANDLKRVLLRYGLYTIIIKDIIEEILEAQNAFFDLFNAFLSLGLIIGIIGLGIVTLRSVFERRHEIGMMRAIGFKKRAVVASFLGESAFIAGSGLLIGTVLGIILGWMLWRDSFGETMTRFGVPWLKLSIIVGIAFLVALASSVPPSYKASRVTPADALRYE